jgi:hypothetical protein
MLGLYLISAQHLARVALSTFIPRGGIPVSLTVGSNGIISGSSVASFTWLLSGAASDYDVRITVGDGTGTISGAATGTWLNCDTSRTWNMTGSILDYRDTILELRDTSTGTILATGAANFEITS